MSIDAPAQGEAAKEEFILEIKSLLKLQRVTAQTGMKKRSSKSSNIHISQPWIKKAKPFHCLQVLRK